MESLTEGNNRVRALAYVVLGVFLIWCKVFAAAFFDWPENKVVSVFVILLPVVNLGVSVILWRTFQRAAGAHRKLVGLAVGAAILPWLLLAVDFASSD